MFCSALHAVCNLHHSLIHLADVRASKKYRPSWAKYRIQLIPLRFRGRHFVHCVARHRLMLNRVRLGITVLASRKMTVDHIEEKPSALSCNGLEAVGRS